ncbi:Crp/Fnr family transcriptional regulator [Sporosarcina aquimarina]|uniref:Crp/Fnr family transcriptional regulator n=1 Tax=Sporosarcina aquimarina TaxID=114975 RepID=A0ABU4FVN1_9BACL|nr:Crp/Fnr family transcriptional regulator [Sporosarcina aquimarina]MDW0108716.1 Crp/Fnr family transcriptional regulator [Sporosarcina aquimarina]
MVGRNASGNEMEHSCIQRVPIFNHLEATEMLEVAKHAHSETYRKGETVYNAGEQSNGLYIVHKGQVKVYRLAENGKEQLIRILKPGEFTGELSLFKRTEHDAFAETLATTELCVMDRDDFQSFLMKYPEVALKMLSEFSTRLQVAEQQMTRNSLESAENRIAMYLAELSLQQQSETISLPISRKDIASYLGTTPETVSRKLAEFEDLGVIRQEGQRKIGVLNLEKLQEYSL